VGQDDQTVPVTVTVHLPRPSAVHPPHAPLPYTGAPVAALAALGIVFALTGSLVLALLRRTISLRSSA
jgi:hypothetical protein